MVTDSKLDPEIHFVDGDCSSLQQFLHELLEPAQGSASFQRIEFFVISQVPGNRVWMPDLFERSPAFGDAGPVVRTQGSIRRIGTETDIGH